MTRAVSGPPIRFPIGRVAAYRAQFTGAVRSVTAYGYSFTSSMFGGLCLLIATLYLWHSILAQGSSTNGWNWPTMQSYLLAAFVCSSVVGFWAYTDMAHRILDGMVAVDLCRPLGFRGSRMAETGGFAVLELGMAGSSAIVIALVLHSLAVPATGSWLPFVLSFAIALMLKFYVGFIALLACFWTRDYLGIVWTLQAFTVIFSGSLVPISMYPNWLRLLADVLPFEGMASTPAMIFSGQLTGSAIWHTVVVQFAWLIVLWVLSGLAFRVAARRLTIHGG